MDKSQLMTKKNKQMTEEERERQRAYNREYYHRKRKKQQLTAQEYQHQYYLEHKSRRAKALAQTQQALAEAEQRHLHFILHEYEHDTWSIEVEGEQGIIRDVSTQQLPHYVHALYLMGKTLRQLRMRDDWDDTYAQWIAKLPRQPQEDPDTIINKIQEERRNQKKDEDKQQTTTVGEEH